MSITILRMPQLTQKVRLSRSSIYLALSEDKFPKPIRLGARSVGWLESEVDAWIESKRRKDAEPMKTPNVGNPSQLNQRLQAKPFDRFSRVLR